MTVFLRYKHIILGGLLPSLAVKEIDLEKFKNAEGLYIADPWERVKSIFSVDDFGNSHPELLFAWRMAQYGALAGGVFGGIIQAMKETEKFLHITDTQIYANAKEANRALNDIRILAMIKGACKWAPRFALFCGGFILISSCCELYFNEYRVISYTIGGTSIGALFKVHFGFKGMISGGIVGGVLGTIYGLTLWGVYKISKTDNIQFKYAHFAYTKYRQSRSLHSKNNIYDNPSILKDIEDDSEDDSIPTDEKTKKMEDGK